MPVESVTYVDDLVPAYPAGTEPEKEGDNHLRNIKQGLKNTFPNADKAFYFPQSISAKDVDYAVQLTDENGLIPFTNTAARTCTLPSGASLPDGFTCGITKTNDTAFAVTVSAGFMDGSSEVALRWQGDSLFFRWHAASAIWTYWRSERSYQKFITKSDNFTVDMTQHQCIIEVSTSGGSKTATLPSTLKAGFRVAIVKSSSDDNALVLSAAAGINGVSTLTLLEQHMMVELIWTGSAWRAPYMDALVRRLGGQELLGGFTLLPFDAGTRGSGTYQPNPFNGNKQFYQNTGPHSIIPPDSPSNVETEILNASGAGEITLSAFTKVIGSFTTTVGHKFIADIRKTQNYSLIVIASLQ